MSRQAIIDKIHADAELKATSFVKEQQEKADEILAQAAEECRDYLYRYSQETDNLVTELLSRSETVAHMDAKKVMLNAKMSILDEVFARALKKLASLDVKVRKKLLLKMLEAASDGDVVILSKNEQGVLNEADIAQFAERKKLRLTLSDEQGNFAGGVVLSGGGVDKNLTYEVELASLRERLEADIARELFD